MIKRLKNRFYDKSPSGVEQSTPLFSIIAIIHPLRYPPPVPTPKKDRSHWPQAKLASFDEVRAYRIKQWQDAGCSARLNATWELVTDYWVGMKHKHPDELRLQRSVTNIRRRAS